MTTIPFSKLQGCGNDYIFVEDWQGDIQNPESLSIAVSDRHFGVGSDGLILVQKASTAGADARMRMFNADGSEGEMCGNGVRGFVKYLYDRRLLRAKASDAADADQSEVVVETKAGLIRASVVEATHGKATRIHVDMGVPTVQSASLEEQLEIDGRSYGITRISNGVPHCVLFVPNFDFDYRQLGRKIETHPLFPAKTNVDFVQLLPGNRHEFNFRVWERGSGETLACGTGACASVVAAVLHGHVDRKVRVHLLGGDLDIEWRPDDKHVSMTGPSVEVCSGVYNWDTT